MRKVSNIHKDKKNKIANLDQKSFSLFFFSPLKRKQRKYGNRTVTIIWKKKIENSSLT